MDTRELFVFAHLPGGFVPAGRLTLTEDDRSVEASSFAYGMRYLDRRLRFEIDPVSLDLTDADKVRGVELHPANALSQFGGIRDAAPDAWGRRVIEARHRVPPNSFPESVYLVESGGDRVGALDIRPSLDTPPRPGTSDIRTLAYLLEAAERIETGEPVPARLTDLFGSGPGAGGARPKATVRDDSGLLWLAKFPSRSDTFDIAQAEYATLRLAALCGMTVPDLRLELLGDKRVLLVRRFDRYWHAPNQLPADDLPLYETLPVAGREEGRLPFVSGLTLVACDEFDSHLKGYGDLAQAIRRHVHVRTIRRDNSELFTRMIFNIFVSNDDDHLRNHGFIRDPRIGGWQLSPLYDVVPRPALARERYLHLQVGPQGKLATLDNAIAAHAAFTLERTDALSIIRRIWSVLRQWKYHFESFNIAGKLIDQLEPAFRDLDEIATPALAAEIRRH